MVAVAALNVLNVPKKTLIEGVGLSPEDVSTLFKYRKKVPCIADEHPEVEGFVVSAQQLYEQLGMTKDFRGWIRQHLVNPGRTADKATAYFKEDIDYKVISFKEASGQASKNYFLTAACAEKLKIKYEVGSARMSQDFRWETSIVKDVMFFCEGLNILDCKEQEPVSSYRVDLAVYDSGYRCPVFVEFDEKYHKGSSQKEKDLERMVTIGKVVGNCIFLRISEETEYRTSLRDCVSFLVGPYNEMWQDSHAELRAKLDPLTQVYEYYGDSLKEIEEKGSWDILELVDVRAEDEGVLWREEVNVKID